MNNEEELRSALAFILSQENMGSARDIAFESLKKVYPSEFKWKNVKEFDDENEEIFDERMQELRKHYSEVLK